MSRGLSRGAATLVLGLLAAAPAAGWERSFRIEAGEGETLAQKVEVPVESAGRIAVEAEWSGGRSLKVWIEDGKGKDLGRWGGISPGRLEADVPGPDVAGDAPLVVRIRTIGRNGSVDGRLVIRFPVETRNPVDLRPPSTSIALPDTAREPAADAPAPGPAPAHEGPFAGLPEAGSRWTVPLARLHSDLRAEEAPAVLRALLEQAAGVASGYVDVDDPETGPTEEWGRRHRLEELGREVSALIRLVDEAGLDERTGSDLRRVLATLAQLSRRREGGGEGAGDAREALAALAGSLSDMND